MAQPAANLRVRISADLADIKQGLGLLRGELAKVKKEAAQTTPDTTKWAAGIGKVRAELVNLAGAYIGIRGIATGVQALFAAFDRADRIGEVARIAGVSTEALSRLAFAAKFSDVELEGLQTGFKTFNKELVANSGLIGKVGVEIFEAGTKNFRPTEQIILDLADVFASLPDGPERAALAVKLFGKSGGDLIPVLIEGRKQLEEYGKQADATGNTISEAAAASAGEFNDNLDLLKGTLTGVANETAKHLIPAVAGYAAEAANAGQQSNFAAEGGKFLASVFKVVAAGAIIVKNVVEGAATVLAFLGDTALRVSNVVAGTLGKTLGAVAASAKSLLSGANPLAVFSAFQSSLKDVAGDAKANLAGIRSGFSLMKDGVSDAAGEIAQVGKMFSDATQQATADTKGLTAAAEGVKPASQAALEAIRELLAGGGDKGGKDSDAAAKLKKLREEAERLRKEEEKAAAERLKEQEDLAKDLGQVKIKLLELDGETGRAARAQLEEEYLDLFRRLEKASDEAGAAMVRNLIERLAAKAQLDQIESKVGEATGSLQGTETSISAQVSAGMLSSLEGERQLEAARKQAIITLAAARQSTLEYLATLAPGSMEADAARLTLQGINTDIANIVASQNQWKQDVESAGQSSLMTFFSDLKNEAMSAGEAVLALGANFADAMYQMAATAVSKKIVGAISSLFNKGGSGDEADVAAGATKLSSAATATALAGGVITFGATSLSSAAKELQAAATSLMIANTLGSFGAAHGGGTVGALTMTRHGINPMVFGAAPRYHDGGIAGLRPGEVPAILMEGERIRTEQQEAALQAQLKAGSSDGLVTTPIVAIGEAAIADAMASAAGGRVILTHVREGWAGLNQGES
jgi:hypothetical protein